MSVSSASARCIQVSRDALREPIVIDDYAPRCCRSCGYVADWSGGGEQALAQIKAAGMRIQRTADRILSALEGAFENLAEAAGAAET